VRRDEVAAHLATRWAIARVLDQATVELLALTSPPDAVIRAAYEDRRGVPAYDDAPGLEPRDTLETCRYCRARFWRRRPPQLYCSRSCSARAAYRRARARASKEDVA
jgi:hypothetical protein